MGGTVSKALDRALGKKDTPAFITEAVEPVAKAQAQKSASAEAAEDAAARRRARRGGRALLSEARIAPETGLQQTLGTGV
jgi:hypothetical protein